MCSLAGLLTEHGETDAELGPRVWLLVANCGVVRTGGREPLQTSPPFTQAFRGARPGFRQPHCTQRLRGRN